MTERPDLSLSATERARFLRDVLTDGELVAYATSGTDGYPLAGLSAAHVGDDDATLVFDDAGPPDGATVCAIVERGATYDEITAVVARGAVRDRALSLDDVVSFAFAKLTR